MRDAKKTYAAPALDKAFEVLEMLAEQPKGALISEMATALNRTVGELFRIVVVMEKMGYLRKSPADDRYSVAYKLLDLAFRATPAQDLVAAALPTMRQLAIDSGQSCHLVVNNEGAGLVIAREQNPGTRGFSLRLGAAVDLLTSCSGQVLLAFATEEERERILAQASAKTGRTVDREALQRRIDLILRHGYEQRKSPITYGVTDISFPLFGFNGDVVGVLTIPFMQLIDGSQTVDLDVGRDMLRAAAARVSEALGFSRHR